MKSLKIKLLGLAITGAVVMLSTVSFADEGQNQAKIKNLNDAAVALVKSNPDLAQSLTKFALQEAVEKEDKNVEKKESEGMNEDANIKEHAKHIKLLRDSATALKVLHPELALNLLEMADRSEKRIMVKVGKEDKEEKGEKNEDGQKK